MLSKNIEKLINEQINWEMYSAYLYLSMSSWLEEAGYPGFANWFFVQYKEETDHALYMRKYMHNEGAKVTLDAIAKPDSEFAGVADILERTFAHEKKVTGLINNIEGACMDERDFRTMHFMDWYVKEQTEEETNCQDNIMKLKRAGENGMYQLDQDFAARVYAASLNPPVVL